MMKEFKGTPGLWSQNWGNEVYDYGDEGEGYCSFFTVECKGHYIARCEDEYDAILMATAPELLSILRDIISDNKIINSQRNEANRIINKALGITE